MKLNEKIEEKLKDEVVRYLEHGRVGWDLPHTLASVYWMKELISKEGGDEKILITVMYLHDIGYPQLRKGYDFKEATSVKKNHAEISAIEAEKILRKLKVYSDKETEEIIHLIRNHSNLDNIDSLNRQMVFEADGLGKIDWERVPPNFDKKNASMSLNQFKEEKMSRFKTETGKKYMKELLIKCEEYLA